jgi:hypothetical protein
VKSLADRVPVPVKVPPRRRNYGGTAVCGDVRKVCDRTPPHTCGGVCGIYVVVPHTTPQGGPGTAEKEVRSPHTLPVSNQQFQKEKSEGN